MPYNACAIKFSPFLGSRVLSDDSQLHRIDDIAEQYLKQIRNGESVSIEEIVSVNNDIAEPLREVLETLHFVNQRKEREHKNRLPDLADFEIIRQIGAGGMGIVYKAKQRSLGRFVALKIVPQLMLGNELAIRRFELEARTAAQLQHPNIVPVFDVGNANGVYYYSMQLISGCGLDRIIASMHRQRQDADSTQQSRSTSTVLVLPNDVSEGNSSEFEVDEFARGSQRLTATEEVSKTRQPNYYLQIAEIGRDVANALAHSHNRGVIHRDIKPSNLLIDHVGHVWVTDFGLAKTEDSDLTRTGDVVGTLRFMAPERINGLCDRRSDIYSLGMTLYELLALQPAFSGGSQLSIVKRIRDEEPKTLRSIDAGVPRDLQTIVEKAIHKEPSLRYQSADQMADDLELFLKGLPIKARRVGTTERVWRWGLRNRAVASSLILIVLLVLLGLVGSSVAAIRFRSMAIKQTQLKNKAERAEQQQRQSADLAKKMSKENRRHLYNAEMKLAVEASTQPTGLANLRELLHHWIPDNQDSMGELEEDLRGFEWYWLQAIAERPVTKIIDSDDSSKIGLHPVLPRLYVGYGHVVQIIDWMEGKEVISIQFGSDISAVAYSNRGDRIAVVGQDGRVNIYDAENGIQLGGCVRTGAFGIAWVQNDAKLVLLLEGGSAQGTGQALPDCIDLVDVVSGQSERTLVAGVDFSKTELQPVLAANGDSTRVVIAGQRNSQVCLMIFDTVNQWMDGERIWEGHPLSAVRWHPNDDRIAAASFDRRLLLFDAADESFVLEKVLQLQVKSIDWVWQDDSLLLGAQYGSLQQVSAKDLEPTEHFFCHEYDVCWARVHSENGTRLSYSSDTGIVVWKSAAKPIQQSQNVISQDIETAGKIAWSPDGHWLALCNGVPISVRDGGTGELKLRTPDNYSILGDLHGWSNDATLVTSYRDSISVWDGKSLELVDRFKHDESATPNIPFHRTQISPDGKHLLLQAYRYREHWGLYLLDMETQQTTPLVERQSGYLYAGPVWSPNGDFIAVGAAQKIILIDAKSGEIVREAPWESQISVIAWSDDGLRLAVADDSRKIRIVAADDLKHQGLLVAHTATVRCLDWSPDGRRLASGSDDQNVILWDTEQHRAVISIHGNAPVGAIKWSPNGRQLASFDRAGRAVIFDAAQVQ